MNWQLDYSYVYYEHRDPDARGSYAASPASYVTEPSSRRAVRDWIRVYPHAAAPLGPLLLSIPIGAGVSRDVSYAVLSSLCGFISLVLIFRILRHRLGVTHVTALVASTLFVCQMNVLSGFGRPGVDSLGLLLTVWMLDGLIARFTGTESTATLGLSMVAFCLPLARPQGPAYWPFIYAAVCWSHWRKTGGFDVPFLLREGRRIFLVPLLALLGLYLFFDWFDNFELALQKARLFRNAFSWANFQTSMMLTLQICPLFWFALPRQRAHRAVFFMLLGWAAFYLAMLAAVKAPLWARHFIPLAPSIIICTALSIDGLRRARRPALAAVSVLIAANVYRILDRNG